MKAGVIAVDLGGTLIDDSPAWIASACHISGKDPNEFQYLLGNGSSRRVYEAIVGHSDVLEMEYFWYIVYKNYFDKIIVFESLVESLKSMEKAFHICLFTNKRPDYARYITERLGIQQIFEDIVGGDTFGRKPWPEGLRQIQARFEAFEKECYYVGDSKEDRKCAELAGWRFVAAAWAESSSLVQEASDLGFLLDGAKLPDCIEGC